MDVKDHQLPIFQPHGQSGLHPGFHGSGHADRKWRSIRRIALVGVGMIILAGYFQYGRWNSCHVPTLVLQTGGGLPSDTFQQTWAAYSPYFPAAEYIPPPDTCVITQVNLLQRHGARYPTKSATKKMQSSLQKLLNVNIYANGSLNFLRDFEWDLGTNDMISFGKRQTFESGVEHFNRYQHLFSSDQIPFVRASGSDRVIKSAMIWSDGIAFASKDVYHPQTSVIIPEVAGTNNTLEDGSCPNAHTIKKERNAWRDIFAPPIADRLNAAAPGANLKSKDVVQIMPLCAFETLFHGKTSPFCDLFTFDEYEAHEYYNDLSKFYKTGPGNPFGPVQGVGYVNELLARLTSQPVRDDTQTNSTLDSSPDTFPLNRTFYADFSHDNQMVAIYSAMGLFQQGDEREPSSEVMNPGRRWRISKLTPFSGRMIVEKLECDDDLRVGRVGKEYVRILVNDALQPLTFCGAGEDGLCLLKDFVESQSYARGDGNGDWDKCFE